MTCPLQAVRARGISRRAARLGGVGHASRSVMAGWRRSCEKAEQPWPWPEGLRRGLGEPSFRVWSCAACLGRGRGWTEGSGGPNDPVDEVPSRGR